MRSVARAKPGIPNRRLMLVCALVSALAPAAARAAGEEAVPAGSKPPPAVRFRGGPLSVCRSFFITEAGLHLRLNETEWLRNRSLLFTGEFGYMVNVSARDAAGGTLYLGVPYRTAVVGLKGRYRRWLGGTVGYALAAGVFLALLLTSNTW